MVDHISSILATRHLLVAAALTGLAVALGCGSSVSDPEPFVLVLEVDAPGLGAADVDAQLAAPLTVAVGGLPGLRRSTAHSREGHAEITLVFEDDPEWNSRRRMAVLTDVADVELVDGAVVSLRPVVTSVVAVPVDAVDVEAVEAKKRTVERTPGVAKVESVGLSTKRVVFRYDPARLASFGVTVAELRDSVRPKSMGLHRRAMLLDELLDQRVGQVVLRDLVSVEERLDPSVASVDGEPAAWLVVSGTEAPEDAFAPASVRVQTVTGGRALAGVLREAGAESVRWLEEDGQTTAWATGAVDLSAVRTKEQGRVLADDVRTWAIDEPLHGGCSELIAERMSEEALWVTPRAAPSVQVRPRRELLAQLGLSTTEVASAVRLALAPVDVGWVLVDGVEIPLVLESGLSPLETLEVVRVGQVTIAEIADIEIVELGSVWRVNGLQVQRTVADFPADLDVEMAFGTFSCAAVSVQEQPENWR